MNNIIPPSSKGFEAELWVETANSFSLASGIEVDCGTVTYVAEYVNEDPGIEFIFDMVGPQVKVTATDRT